METGGQKAGGTQSAGTAPPFHGAGRKDLRLLDDRSQRS